MRREALLATVLAALVGACSKPTPSGVTEEAAAPVADADRIAAARKMLASHESTRELAAAEDVAAEVAVALARCASDLEAGATELARAEGDRRRREKLKRRIEARIDVSVAYIAETKAISQGDSSATLDVASVETDLREYRRSVQEVKARQDELRERIKELKARTEALKSKLALLKTVKAKLPRPAPRADGVAAARDLLASHRSTQGLAEADDLAAKLEELLARDRKGVELLEKSVNHTRKHLRKTEEFRERKRAQTDRTLATLAEARGRPERDESRRRDMALAKERLGHLRRDMHELGLSHAELVERITDKEARIEETRAWLRVLEAAKAKLKGGTAGGSNAAGAAAGRE
ncbi:MAG: hypothetical protein ACYTFI_15430 [Planctomycetota bacterium]|jgi:chromosome segregation ATPase